VPRRSSKPPNDRPPVQVAAADSDAVAVQAILVLVDDCVERGAHVVAVLLAPPLLQRNSISMTMMIPNQISDLTSVDAMRSRVRRHGELPRGGT